MSNSTESQDHGHGHDLLTAKQLGQRLNLSAEKVLQLQRTKAIPVVRLGYKTLRFQPGEVIKALDALTQKESQNV